jgi:biofilm PGA synthesis N-glycosyltransferase PgaC
VRLALEVLLLFVALYPVVTAALWIAGGLMFKLIDEGDPDEVPAGGWPGVTVLIPAYNEEAVIATSVRAALTSEYPRLEVLVLDHGSRTTPARWRGRRPAATRAARWCATRSTAARLSG